MSDKVIHYCRHCGDTLGGDNPCDCPGASIDAVLTGQANEIAALTERLRIVEAERDEARSGVKRAAESYGALMSTSESLRSQLSALRTELERKDAALKSIKHLDDLEAHQLSQTSWKWLCDKLNAALQPKEPPCKTA